MAKRTCSVEDCDGPAKARGLCTKHYQRLMRLGTTEMDRSCRWCGSPDVTSKDGVPSCAPCQEERKRLSQERARARMTPAQIEARRRQQREYHRSPRGAQLRNRARDRRKYRMEPGEYEARLDEQGGVCAICKKPEVARGRGGSIRRLAVDHDHIDGRVRGLLCSLCNCLIGWAQDDLGTLQAAITYLTRL